MTQTCPACGHAAEGRFCSNCGAGLDADVTCAECGNQLPRGGRFCNQCGAATPATRMAAAGAAQAGPRPSPLPWVVAGAAILVAGAAFIAPRLGKEEAPAPAAAAPAAPFAGGAGAPGGGPSSVDLSSMTPREAADRLFNRVMTAVSSGDTAQARQFLPMALGAYQQVPDLDLDGHFHLAQLHKVNGDPKGERAEADVILKASPNHLFGLFSAAEAEADGGNAAAARDLYKRFLQHYDAELARGLPEYKDHEPLLPQMKQQAERVAGK